MLKECVLDFEKLFNSIRKNDERFQILFVILYFTPPVIALIYTSQFRQDLFENMIFKVILFSIFTLGVVIHYALRNKYRKGRDKYIRIIKNYLAELEKIEPEKENLKKSVMEIARQTFMIREITFSGYNVKSFLFWDLLFQELEMEMEDNED